MSYYRRKAQSHGPSPSAIARVPRWAIINGTGHALRGGGTRGATTWCGRQDYRWDRTQPETPKRICRDCASLLEIEEKYYVEPRPAPPVETQGRLF